MDKTAQNTEQLLTEVLREVRELRAVVEAQRADADELDSLDYYEHPEDIRNALEAAVQKHGKPQV